MCENNILISHLRELLTAKYDSNSDIILKSKNKYIYALIFFNIFFYVNFCIFLHVKRDGQGQTPLMLAVSVRAYHAALILLDTIQRVGKDVKDTSVMILPADASPDLSPLFVTCCNDTCSFTWTGAEHINQVLNIYLCV